MPLPRSPAILPFQNDWHQADIIAALRKKGTTPAALSRESGLSSSTHCQCTFPPKKIRGMLNREGVW